MKILHIGKYYPPALGGIEYFLQDLVREQVKIGHQVKILCHQHAPGRTKITAKEGLEIYRASSWGTFAYAPISPSFGRYFLRLKESFAPSIIHIHLPNLSAFWLLRYAQNIPIVIHWHSDVLTSNKQMKLRLLYPGYRFFEHKLLQKANKVIVTSNEYLKYSKALENYRTKCLIIPLGLSLDRLRVRNKSSNYHTDTGLNKSWFINSTNKGANHYEFIVLSVGRFTYYKGFEYLIRAAQYFSKTKFILVGEGPLKKKMQKLCHKIGVSDYVILPGKLTDEQLSELMEACDVFCLPSVDKTEAFGLVLLEAMAYGKPLITTEVQGSGMNEVNIHGQTGLIVAPESVDQLVRGLHEILYKPEWKSWAGVNSEKRLLGNFLISNVANQIDKVYFSCLT